MLLVAVALLPVAALLSWTTAETSPGDARLLVRNLGLVAVVAVLAFGVAWIASDALILRSTRGVVAAARRLESGDLSARTGLPPKEGELGELAHAFDDMASALQTQQEELRKVDAIKTRILNAAAHELKTPITPLKLQVHLLKSRSEAFDERERRAVGVLDRNVDRLAVLVEAVLDVARLQSGKLDLRWEDVELAPLLAEALEAFAEHARASGLDLRLEAAPGLRVRGDPVRLEQVVYNLLSNAVKFTPSGGRILVRASPRGKDIAVEVADTGVGITADDAKRLFQPFSHARAANVDTDGAGLGLYISRGIIERHGGRIGVDSAGPGRGSTFFFELPALEAAMGAATEAAREKQPPLTPQRG